MKLAAIAIVVLVLTACDVKRAPTCEERGGRTVARMGMWWTGKAFMLVPRYDCEGARP